MARVVVIEAWRLELTRRSPKNSAWLLYLKGIVTLPIAFNSNAAARAFTGTSGFLGLVRSSRPGR